MRIVAFAVLAAFALVGAFAVGVFALAHFENPASTFRTYEELKVSGLIERGWVSAYLPRSATEIRESHDLDTNRGWASFKYSMGDSGLAREACHLIHQTKDGAKYLCPPFEGQTSILVLKTDGRGELTTHADEI